MREHVFLRQQRAARGDLADQRQADFLRRGHQLAHAVLQADAARGAGDELDQPLLGERLQVLLGRVERAEAEGARDLVARGRGAALGERLADELEDLRLARRDRR